MIALKYLEELDNEDVARILEKPVGAVNTCQHRALASLQTPAHKGCDRMTAMNSTRN